MDYKAALDSVDDELDSLSFGLPQPVQEANTKTAQLKVGGRLIKLEAASSQWLDPSVDTDEMV